VDERKKVEGARTSETSVGDGSVSFVEAGGLTQEQTAEQLGMLAANYARVEQGRANVTVDTLVRVVVGQEGGSVGPKSPSC
jgi:hypothetical protein